MEERKFDSKSIKTLNDWFELTKKIYKPNERWSELRICEYDIDSRGKDSSNYRTVFSTTLRPEIAKRYFGDYILIAVENGTLNNAGQSIYSIIKPDLYPFTEES